MAPKLIIFLYFHPTETTLWEGPGPRFEPGTGDLAAETLTTSPPHLIGPPYLLKLILHVNCEIIVHSHFDQESCMVGTDFFGICS